MWPILMSEYGIIAKGIEMSDSKQFGECPEHEKLILESVEYIDSVLKASVSSPFHIFSQYVQYVFINIL